jgi:hypothetical protein
LLLFISCLSPGKRKSAADEEAIVIADPEKELKKVKLDDEPGESETESKDSEG